MTRVKICGITTAGDARYAAELGAWAIGLIFHEPSPRSCDVEVAEGIGGELRRELEIVGVFVNEPLDRVAELADRCSLSISSQLISRSSPRSIARLTLTRS